MQSVNHQFIELSDEVEARYIKTVLSPISGYRLNPRDKTNPNARLDFLLATPEKSLKIEPYESGQPTKHKQVSLDYEAEVLELYSAVEVKAFERMNRQLIENGILVPYSGTMRTLDTKNILTDIELRKLATMKTTNVFKTRIAAIDSVPVLTSILDMMEELDDAKYAHIKALRARIKELE